MWSYGDVYAIADAWAIEKITRATKTKGSRVFTDQMEQFITQTAKDRMLTYNRMPYTLQNKVRTFANTIASVTEAIHSS